MLFLLNKQLYRHNQLVCHFQNREDLICSNRTDKIDSKQFSFLIFFKKQHCEESILLEDPRSDKKKKKHNDDSSQHYLVTKVQRFKL